MTLDPLRAHERSYVDGRKEGPHLEDLTDTRGYSVRSSPAYNLAVDVEITLDRPKGLSTTKSLLRTRNKKVYGEVYK